VRLDRGALPLSGGWVSLQAAEKIVPVNFAGGNPLQRRVGSWLWQAKPDPLRGILRSASGCPDTLDIHGAIRLLAGIPIEHPPQQATVNLPP
jgi:hypothetical protein